MAMKQGRDCLQRDYYRLLQIAPGASQMEIINAYRHAKLAYHPDSLAIYSLYSEEELTAILDEVEEAYSVLSDPEKRREYDATRISTEVMENHPVEKGGAERRNVVPLCQRNAEGPVRLTGYRGADMRRFREESGITLEAIAERTKISRRYLQAIEDEDEANFPEAVYLKGYLRQYCREIGLDPEQAVLSYLSQIESGGG